MLQEVQVQYDNYETKVKVTALVTAMVEKHNDDLRKEAAERAES